MTRFLALLFAVLLVSPAYAQSTRSQLNTEINTNYPDNTTGLITPQLLRQTTQDMVTSGAMQADTNIYTADNFFGSGRPWCDVRAKGAVGNGSTDDTAAFVACATSSMVYVPNGNYCIKTSGGVTFSSTRTWILGEGTGVLIQTCGADVTPVTLNATGLVIQNLSVQGPDILTTTHDALDIGASCVECRVINIHAQYGRNAIFTQGPDTSIEDTRTDVTYGTAHILVRAVTRMTGVKTDQNFVGSVPAAGSLSLAAWTGPGHVYAANAIVIVTQGGVDYKIQTVAGGTSGGSTPVIPSTASYTSSFSDGGVTWKLLAPDTYYAVQIDTGAFSFNARGGDYTGPFSAGLGITNTLAGIAPESIYVTASTGFGNNFVAGIYARAGNDLHVSNSQIANCLNSGCAGILFADAWAGDASIFGNTFFHVAQGVLVGVGVNHTIIGNQFYGGVSGAAGTNIAANVNTFNVSSNVCGNSAAWTPVANCTIVNAGTSDHYVINNICDGVTSNCVLDSGTGIDKAVYNSGTQFLPKLGTGGETTPQIPLVASANTTTNISFPSGWISGVVGADGVSAFTGVLTFNNGTGTQGPTFQFTSARGTAAAATALQSGDTMGIFGFRPYIGNATVSAANTARVQAVATENQSNSNQGNKLVFATTKNTTTTRSDNMTLDGNQHLQVGTTIPTINSCATGSVTTGSTDQAGQATATGATTCAINFATAYASAPTCVASDVTRAAALQVSATTGVLTVAGLTANDVFSWICFPKVGG